MTHTVIVGKPMCVTFIFLWNLQIRGFACPDFQTGSHTTADKRVWFTTLGCKPYLFVAWFTWTDIILFSQDLLLSWNKTAHENTWTSLVSKAMLVIWYTPLSLCLFDSYLGQTLHACRPILRLITFFHAAWRILPSITLLNRRKKPLW